MSNWFFSATAKPAYLPVAGLCPLLAVSNTLVKGFAMGLACMLALIMTMLSVSCMRKLIAYRIRLPLLLLISTSMVTVIHLAMQAFFYELSMAFGMYIPLLAVNTLLLSRIEDVALSAAPMLAIAESFITGLGVLCSIAILGAMRELLAYGCLFGDADLLFGESGRKMILTISNLDPDLGVMAMAPGAFLVLGVSLALVNYVHSLSSASFGPGGQKE